MERKDLKKKKKKKNQPPTSEQKKLRPIFGEQTSLQSLKLLVVYFRKTDILNPRINPAGLDF